MKILKLTTYAKEYALQLVLLGTVITTGYMISENTKTYQRVLNLEGGISTCFQRVNQTFTAKIINDQSSVYLTQNFQSLTEECMAEGLVSAEELLRKTDGATFKKLSTLASSIHWFHEDILSGGGANALTGKTKTVANPSERFEKIESLKDDVFEGTDALKSGLNEATNVLKIAFAALIGLLAVAVLIELFRQTKRRYTNHLRETEAQSELFDYAVLNPARSIDILKNSLENNDLHYCAKLFGRLIDGTAFQTSAQGTTREVGGKTNIPAALQMLTPKDTEQATRQKLDLVWEDPTMARSADGFGVVDSLVEETLTLKEKNRGGNPTTNKNSVNLENCVEKIFDLVSDRVFKSGIAIELNMDSSLNVQFSNEELEQVLFQVFNNALRSLEAKTEKTTRKLTINGIKLGSSVVLDVINSGTLQTESVVDQRTNDIDEANIGLTICEAFMEEHGGKVQFDSIINNQGVRTGEIVKLVFKGAEANIQPASARLVDVKVGTKKEILDLISQ